MDSNALKQNTTLFFQWVLEWSQNIPVRRTFFHDIPVDDSLFRYVPSVLVLGFYDKIQHNFEYDGIKEPTLQLSMVKQITTTLILVLIIGVWIVRLS